MTLISYFLFSQVWFANEFVSVSCQNPINWNFLLENPQDPSTTRIVCDLPPREGSKGSDWFSLILQIDGEDVPNDFTVRYRDRYTPLIKSVSVLHFIYFRISCHLFRLSPDTASLVVWSP